MSKRYLFVLRKPSHTGITSQEMLDVILTSAAFDQAVSVLLLDDAVFHLKKSQRASAQNKDMAALFQALELYDVHDIYVETESLQERGLTVNELNLSVQQCTRKDVNHLMRQFDVLFAG